jgi:YbbR domain-containing protein
VNGERRQIWSLRVLAVAIAIALWFALSYENRETRSEKVLEADITYMRPDATVILDPLQRAEVLLSGPQDAVNRVSPTAVTVQVDLREWQPGPANVNLSADNVRLPPGLRVDRIRPNTLRLTLDRELTRRLPVEVQVVGEPAAGALVGDLTVTPPEVAVTGPESQVSTLDAVQTAPVDLDGHALTFDEVVAVVLPDILAISEIEPPRVTVHVPLSLSAPPGGGQRRSNR